MPLDPKCRLSATMVVGDETACFVQLLRWSRRLLLRGTMFTIMTKPTSKRVEVTKTAARACTTPRLMTQCGLTLAMAIVGLACGGSTVVDNLGGSGGAGGSTNTGGGSATSSMTAN
jgi:hypothetical protein